MAELVAANLEVTSLQALADQQGAEINRLADIQNRPLTVNVEALSDLLPDPFSGMDEMVHAENFFKKYVSWLAIHRDRFNDNHRKISAFIHCLCGQALVWWTRVNGGLNAPVTVPDLQAMFFAKYMYRKSCTQLNKCKYMIGQSNLGMMNKFLTIVDKLEWPLPVQID